MESGIALGHDDPKNEVDDNAREGGAENRDHDVDDADNSDVPAEPCGNTAADAGNHGMVARTKQSHGTPSQTQ